MDVFSFVATVVLLTASGALAPGPLFFVTISHGTRLGAKSGLVFSVAHTLVEFTLVMLLAFGLLTVANEPIVRTAVGVVGGSVLIVFGVFQIRNFLSPKLEKAKPERVAKRSLLLIGLAFTGLNPFFVVWWLTVGANLILLALEFASFAGVVFMYICHVWMDYLWLTSVAHFSKMGANVLEFKWYRVLMMVFGAILIFYGLNFLVNSLNF